MWQFLFSFPNYEFSAIHLHVNIVGNSISPLRSCDVKGITNKMYYYYYYYY